MTEQRRSALGVAHRPGPGRARGEDHLLPTGPTAVSRILLVGKGAPDRGGIPSFLDMLLAGELGRTHDVSFLNLAHHSAPEGGRATLGNLRRTLRDALAVRARANGQDVVHIHSALAPTVTLLRASLLVLAARSRGCAVVVHAHGGALQSWLTSPLRRRLARLAMKPAHRVVAVWSAGRDLLAQLVPADRVRLIDNGVRTELFSRAPDAGRALPRVLYAGLLTPRKGLLDLLAASTLLHERGIAHELVLVGGTPDEGGDAEAVVRSAANGHARLLGPREPELMPSVYADADVFCLPSWWEAMPLSVLEAMAAGLPVVASDVGDIGRAVDDGETGFLVPPREPQALAQALEKLLTDPALRRRMGDAGQVRVGERFSAEATVRSIAEMYEELLKAVR